MSFLSSPLMLVAIFVIAVAGLVVASVAVNKAYATTSTSTTFVNPKLEQPLTIGAAPTVSLTAGTSFSTMSVHSGSNNSSGSIDGTILAPVDAANTFTVTFSGAGFATAPNAVIITGASDLTTAYHIYVISITATNFRFTVNKTGAGTASGVSLFYYLVL